MFNLEKHLKDHAYFFKKYGEILKQDMHFNFSFLDLQFINKEPKKVMKELLKELHRPTKYKVANGWKKGKQVFANRTIDFSKQILAEAIHLKGPDGKDTMPHIHLIGKKGTRWGKGYSLLKKHISEVASNHGLITNFDEIAEHNPMSIKGLSKAVNAITWAWSKSTTEELHKLLFATGERKGITHQVKLLTDYSLKTNNLTYYVKSMEGLKSRLNRLKTDIQIDGHNLRNTYPLPLTKKDMEVIELLQNKQYTQKAMKPYLSNPILRDFVRHSAGTTKPFIFDALKKQTDLLKGVNKNQKAVQVYQRLIELKPTLKKTELTATLNKSLSIKNDIRESLNIAALSAINEKELRQIMQDAGYKNFGLKKLQGKVIGCFYKESDKKLTVKFVDAGINWSNIKHQMMQNTKKIQKGENLEKKNPIKRDLSRFNKPTDPEAFPIAPKPVKIKYKDTEVAEFKNKEKERSKARRIADEIKRTVEAEINKFKKRLSDLSSSISKLEEKYRSIKTKFTLSRSNKQDLTEKLDAARAEEQELETQYTTATGDERILVEQLKRARSHKQELETEYNIARTDDQHIKSKDYEKTLYSKLTHKIKELVQEQTIDKTTYQPKEDTNTKKVYTTQDDEVELTEALFSGDIYIPFLGEFKDTVDLTKELKYNKNFKLIDYEYILRSGIEIEIDQIQALTQEGKAILNKITLKAQDVEILESTEKVQKLKETLKSYAIPIETKNSTTTKTEIHRPKRIKHR